jgi:predicted metalloprotease
MYCPPSDTISWDGNWLQGDLYRNVGDAAVAFLLAHEYGHLVQQRLGIINNFPLTIEGELNADCLAGAWLGDVNSNVRRLSNVDFDGLDLGVLIVADPRGVLWRNPTSHGTAAERRRALLLGGRGSSQSCLNRLGPGFSA